MRRRSSFSLVGRLHNKHGGKEVSKKQEEGMPIDEPKTPPANPSGISIRVAREGKHQEIDILYASPKEIEMAMESRRRYSSEDLTLWLNTLITKLRQITVPPEFWPDPDFDEVEDEE